MLPKNLNEREMIKRSGKLSIFDGFFSGAMNGFGDRYVSAFALYLGASNFIIALISTFPLLIGHFSQLFSVYFLKKNSRKKMVVFNAFIQALLWIPILFIGVLYHYYESIRVIAPIFVLVFYSCLVIVGSIIGPIWTSWMRDLISVNKGRYFGIRNQIINIAMILSMFTSGVILNYFSSREAIIGFIIIFSLACISRLIAVSFISRQYEPNFVYDESSYFGLREFISKMIFNNFGRFVLYISLFSFAVAISGPFFVVYQLKDLGFNYISFTLVSLAAMITTIIFLPFWGIFSDKYGNIWVLKFTGSLIPILPILWLVTYFTKDSIFLTVGYLVILEFLSGFLWGGFNLSASNFIFDAVSREKMPLCVAYFNFINASFAFIGSMFGTVLVLFNFRIGFVSGFLFIFLFSGVLRFIIFLFMRNKIREVKKVNNFDLTEHVIHQFKWARVVLWKYLGFSPIRLVH